MYKAAMCILGAALLSAWLFTGNQGISEENKKIYKEAVDLQEQADTLGFEGFCLADYPVAMYDGTSDYVFYRGKIEKRTPVLQTFAGTAYPVEDHFEVIIPTLEQFDHLMALTGGVEGMVSGSVYGPLEQKAAIWHEAFHAYQLTDFAILGEKTTAEEMYEELENGGQAGNSENDVLKDGDGVRQTDMEKEMKLLKKAVETDPSAIDEIQRIVLEYSECRRRRMEGMEKAARDAEIRCELTEGTAYYVEASVYRTAAGEKAYKERYLENLDTYEGGRGKYYRTGFAKCLILDRLNPNWKETFDFTRGLDKVLEEYGRK